MLSIARCFRDIGF